MHLEGRAGYRHTPVLYFRLIYSTLIRSIGYGDCSISIICNVRSEESAIRRLKTKAQTVIEMRLS